MEYVKKVFNLVVFVFVVAWLALVITDFLRVKDEKNPLFCISEETKHYSDGDVYRCTGLGYKVYKYDRDSLSAREFGPFFIDERQPESK